MAYKISAEVANEQLGLLLDHYDLEADDIVDTAQRGAFDGAVARLVKAIRKGRLEIKEGGLVIQTLKTPAGEIATIEYGELTGSAKLETDKAGKDDNHGRMYILLGSLSGLGKTAITSLKGVDLSIAECLGLVFMLV